MPSAGNRYCNSSDDASRLEQEMLLPRLFDNRSPAFSFARSKFCRDPSKAGSGRRALSHLDARCGTPQHGLSSNKMALITSDCDAMRSPSIIWP